MKSIYKLSTLAAVVAVVGAGCGGGGSNGSAGGGTTGGGTTGGGTTGGGTTGGTPASNLTYFQKERLARPVVNEVFATVAGNRHLINDTINPTQDPSQLAGDIRSFMTFPAGRSKAITDVVTSVLVPDVMVADLSQTGEAAYLGVETGGATSATKSKFGGRKLQDDVVDMSFGIIFGNTIPALGLAPDDGKEIPSLTKDNVGPSKAYLNTFPYLPAPR